MNLAKSDIKDINDIQLMVNSFYGKIREDDLLGDIFNSRIVDWTIHLEKMYRFWETILLNNHTYSGTPFTPHAQLPINQVHFERWLQLWHSTIDDLFIGEIAEEAKRRGNLMATIFQTKIEYLNENKK